MKINDKIIISFVAMLGFTFLTKYYYISFVPDMLSISREHISFSRSPSSVSNSSCLDLMQSLLDINQEMPFIPELSSTIKSFRNGKSYREYYLPADFPLRLSQSTAYQELIEQTVEIIFEPTPPFGHIRLRVGTRAYSFNYIQSVSIAEFNPRLLLSQTEKLPSGTGFLFALSKEKILQVEDEIIRLYRGSQRDNIPPFDAYSSLLNIDPILKKFKSPSPKNYANNSDFFGTIENRQGFDVLKSETGIELPLISINNEYYLQSYSCSSMVTFVLNRFFNLKIQGGESAIALYNGLLEGNLKEEVSPFMVMRYYDK